MTLTELKAELIEVNNKINKLTPTDSYIDNLPFHLGMVGGSGKNVHKLNKRKERYFERCINASRILTGLYEKQRNLEKQITDIESGAREKRELSAIDRRIKMAEYWRQIKSGDEVALPLGNTITVKKKNRLSIESEGGTKWTASEIIGREAAKLI